MEHNAAIIWLTPNGRTGLCSMATARILCPRFQPSPVQCHDIDMMQCCAIDVHVHRLISKRVSSKPRTRRQSVSIVYILVWSQTNKNTNKSYQALRRNNPDQEVLGADFNTNLCRINSRLPSGSFTICINLYDIILYLSRTESFFCIYVLIWYWYDTL